jgi:hypothetical protein
MDRHLAYVAMTRHRQGVELHASREEFRDGMAELSKSLSRDGAKETTLDYEIRDFAERRGIRVPEAIGRIVAKAFETLRLPKPAFVERMAPAAMAGKDGREQGHLVETSASREVEKGRENGIEKNGDGSARPEVPDRGKAPSFAGLKLPVRQKAASQQERTAEGLEQVKAEGGGKGAETPDQAREAVLKALERHADAIADASRMKGLGLPVVAHQRVALEKSGAALEQVKPGGAKLLQSAHRYDAEAKRVIEGERAPDRAEKLLEATEREGIAQQDPAIRAGRYGERWKALQAVEKAAGRSITREQREEFAAGRKAIVAEIGNDPEAARKLAQDVERCGIGPKSPIAEALRSGKTGQAFTDELERRERAQDQGHER